MNNFIFFDRDISWLSFNERVLQESGKATVPVLERIKFLSIYSSNLDEFYRVRMPALLALQKIDQDGYSHPVYRQAASVINDQQNLFGHILNNDILPALKDRGYLFLYDQPVPETLRAQLSHYFFTMVAGLLQKVSLSGEVDFFPENNRLYMMVVLQEKDCEKLWLLNIPCNVLPRFLKLEEPGGHYIIFLEDIIRNNLHHLFPNGIIEGAYNIKITRDAELNLTDEYDEDPAEKIEQQLNKREKGYAARLLYEPGIPLRHLQSIVELFNLHKASVVEGGHYHNLKDLASLPVSGTGVSYPAWPAIENMILQSTLFERVTQKDAIVHAPYQSYDTILRFFNESSIDPSVQEIFTTLYRVASDSRIAQALISAAKNGKKVTVLVELKARFDEANNIRWAKEMKRGGVQIIYSSNALKVHAKIALIKRNHSSHPYLGLLATGNLNESTARFYTDHIVLTSYTPMLIEMQALFAFLTRRKKFAEEDQLPFKHLLVAPFNLHKRFLQMIEREIENTRKGLPASIIIKMNNLEEEVLIQKLYEASNAGVKIQLIIRGICRLIPGVPGQSERISIKRILDRFLEHGRIFIFYNNGAEEVYMGSADWMNRNIYRRIEVCFPVYDPAISRQIKDIILLQLSDNTQAVWIDANMRNLAVEDAAPAVRSQEAIYHYLQTNESI